jgi:hypothetical protein
MRLSPILLAVVSVVVVACASEDESASARKAYEQRVSEVFDRAVGPATDRFPAYIGAMVHFSFRIDPAGSVSRVRVFAERPSDRPVAQIVAQAIRIAHFPSPPQQVMVEQGHRWFDVPELVYLVGAD